MRQFFITLFGTVVGIFVAFFLLFILLIGIGAAFSPKPTVDKSVVLDLDLRIPMRDQGSGDSLFGAAPSALTDIVRKLDQAKTDDKVKGLYMRANPYGMSPAQAEEIRLAVTDFQTSGKFVISHAQGFEGTSVSNYMAVAGSDEVWIQDTAGFSAAGFRAETPFYGGVFEKFDAQAEFEQFHEYKSAANTYTKKDYTDAHREATTSWLTSLYDSNVANIAVDRDLTEAEIKALFKASPHSAEDALEAGLVDKLGHYAASRDYTLEKAGKGAKFKSMSEYALSYSSGPVIAMIGGQGAIVTGDSAGGNPFAPAVTMGSDTISEAITKAAKDDKVKAIVFRVDSGGGSAIASDQMWDAVNRAKEAGKPVIVSMGQYAASGGYYAAANADKIVAMPTTLTGSIGVLGGKIVLDKTYEKIGYNVEPINVGGDYTAAYSSIENMNQENRAKFRNSMEEIYVDFTTRVAEGRDIPIERVQEIAKGRVWTGVQAKEVGLVDEIGGLMKAIELAKEAADIDADTKVKLRKFPRDLTPGEQFQQLLGSTAQASATLEQMQALANSPEVQALMKARAMVNTPQDMTLSAELPVIK